MDQDHSDSGRNRLKFLDKRRSIKPMQTARNVYGSSTKNTCHKGNGKRATSVNPGEKKSVGSKVFSSLSHTDIDRIIKHDANSYLYKKKFSQMGTSRAWSPPKNNIKIPCGNSFDVVKCLIDENFDNHCAATQVKEPEVHKGRTPRSTKSAAVSEKNKAETEERSSNDNDLVGQIIQNMDQMKPDVISHLITAASQGASNTESADLSSKATEGSVFFKASHKYTYKNYKLSNNVVLEKSKKSAGTKQNNVSSKDVNVPRKEANVSAKNVLNSLSPKKAWSTGNPAKKIVCLMCKSRWVYSIKGSFCSACKRSSEEFPLLKQAQKQMGFLNCRSISAPKQRAHLAALEVLSNKSSAAAGSLNERRSRCGSPKLKNQKLRRDLRERSLFCRKEKILKLSDGRNQSSSPKANGEKNVASNCGNRVHIGTKENKISSTNSSATRKVIEENANNEDRRCVSPWEVEEDPVLAKQYFNILKKLKESKQSVPNNGQSKPVQEITMLKRKKKCKKISSDSEASVCEVTDSTHLASVKNKKKKYVSDSSSETESAGSSDSVAKCTTKNKMQSMAHKTHDTGFKPFKRKKKVKMLPDSDSDESVGTPFQKKVVKKVHVDSGYGDKSLPDLCEPLSLTYTVDEDCIILDDEVQKSYDDDKQEDVVECNNSSDEVLSRHSLSPEWCDQPCESPLSGRSGQDSSSENEAHDSENSGCIQAVCETVSRGTELPRSSETSGFNLNDHTSSCEFDESSEKLPSECELPKEVTNSDTYNSHKTAEDVIVDVPRNSGANCTTSVREQLSSGDEHTFGVPKELEKSNLSTDTGSDMDIIVLSRSPSNSESLARNVMLTNVDETAPLYSGDDIKTEKVDDEILNNATEKSMAASADTAGDEHTFDVSKELEKSNLSTDTGSDTDIIVLSHSPSNSESFARNVTLTNVDETVPLYSGDDIKTEKVDDEILNNATEKSMAASADTAGGEHTFKVSKELENSNLSTDTGSDTDIIVLSRYPSNSESFARNFTLTNVDETVPLYSGDGIKTEKVDDEILNNATEKSMAASADTTSSDEFEDKFYYKKLDDGYYLMSFPNQSDGASGIAGDFINEKDNDVQHPTNQPIIPAVDDSHVLPKNHTTVPSFTERESLTRHKIDGSEEAGNKTPSPPLMSFDFKPVGQGITLMYLSGQENQITDDGCPKSLLSKASSATQLHEDSSQNLDVISDESSATQLHKDSRQNLNVIADESCIELSDDDESCIELSDDNDDVRNQANISTPSKVKPHMTENELESNDNIKQNSASPHASSSEELHQNDSAVYCDDPVVQIFKIAEVYSIPNWDVEEKKIEAAKKNDAVVKVVRSVENNGKDENPVAAEITALESVNYGDINGVQSVNFEQECKNASVDIREKLDLMIKEEAQKIDDNLLREINDSVKEGQCFLNAVSELDSVTSANIIDLELRSSNYLSAIQKAKGQVYEELQQLINRGEQVSSEELQAKINMLRGLELLCKKEVQESRIKEPQNNENAFSFDTQSSSANQVHYELQTTNLDGRQSSFCGNFMPLEASGSSTVNQVHYSKQFVPPKRKLEAVTVVDLENESDFMGQSLSTLHDQFTSYDNLSPNSRLLNRDEQIEPSSRGLKRQRNVMPLTCNARPQQLMYNCNSRINPFVNNPSVVSQHTSNLTMHHVADAMHQLPSAVLDNKRNAVQHLPLNSVQLHGLSHSVNSPLPATVSPEVFTVSASNFGASIFQVNEDATLCVICPRVATAVCKRCAKVAYCGESCAFKYWNEVHHKVCV